uniref:DUF4234 domain-containing protein n=5 Tax=unclassified Prevotella TaxID=2638335 RepID=A0AB33JKM3_9BACT
MKEFRAILFYLYKVLIPSLPLLIYSTIVVYIVNRHTGSPLYFLGYNLSECLSSTTLFIIGLLHFILYAVLYHEKYYGDFMRYMGKYNPTIMSVLTMGIYNTYLLDAYYVVKRYSQDELLYTNYHNAIGNFIAMIPVVNIIIYIRIAYKTHKGGDRTPLSRIIGYYLCGRLISYYIENVDYSDF